MQSANETLAEYPENIPARLIRASILESRNQNDPALRDYRYVLNRHPANQLAHHGVDRCTRREAEYLEVRRQVADAASREYRGISEFFRRPTPRQEFPQGGTATTHHVVGNLYFKILELDRPYNGDTHLLCPIYNGQEALSLTIGLKPEHFNIITRNISNIDELKNIFTTVLSGTNVQGILNIINIAEREAGDRPRIS